jgi:hypothetical protein
VVQPAGDVIAAFDDVLAGSGSFNVTLSFSSLAPNGLLFAAVGSEGDDHVAVQLLDTVVIGSVASNGTWALAQVLKRNMRITDDAMHSLTLAWISELGELHLTLDEAEAPVIANLTAQAGADVVANVFLNGTVYLGNVPSDLMERVRYSRQPFFGCIMDVEVNGSSLVFDDLASNSSLVTGECSILGDAIQKCGPSTCSGNGACEVTQLGAACVCDPGFAAADCGTGMSRKRRNRRSGCGTGARGRGGKKGLRHEPFFSYVCNQRCISRQSTPPFLDEMGFAFDSNGDVSTVSFGMPYSLSRASDIVSGRIHTTERTGFIAVIRSADMPGKDFLLVYIKDGFLTARANLGKGFARSPEVQNDLIALSDGTWHMFAVRRLGMELQLVVDGVDMGQRIADDRTLHDISIDVSPYIVVGNDVPSRESRDKQLRGMLHGLRIYDRPILVDVGGGVVNGSLQ